MNHRKASSVVLVVLAVLQKATFAFSPHHRTLPLVRVERLAAEQNSPSGARKDGITIRDLVKVIEKNPAAFVQKDTTTRKYKRTRKRVDAPKQQYLYAAQRIKLEQDGTLAPKTETEFLQRKPDDPLAQARQLGLVSVAQHCDAPVDAMEPEIIGQIRVGDGDTAGSMAYIISKPVGWSILGGSNKKKARTEVDDDLDDADVDLLTPEVGGKEGELDEEAKKISKKKAGMTQMKIQAEDGSIEVFEYSEADVMALMTPEEIAELGTDLDSSAELGETSAQREKREELRARRSNQTETASFEMYTRPSIVAWLKALKADEGTPIKGGKYWTAVAGATNVDDSGLVVICPKDLVENMYVDFAKYVTIVGNGKQLAPKSKTKDDGIPNENMQLEIIAKLRKGRLEDVVMAIGVAFTEKFSTCSSVVQPCQAQFQDGIRGDPSANPFDRRAPRRLIHCDAISISSLVHDENAQVETEYWPDDIACLAERRNSHEFIEGSFLGRASLSENPLTTAFREINGASDGFDGWTVDRYDKWLFVQHDSKSPRGPLPSIHDGNTVGVYYLTSNSNRGAMGREEVRPKLLEGRPAPEILTVLENGVTYHVVLDKDLSTGIFLDQRPQRAWLTRNCNANTRVLNTFAHCGAFSVAAASAGASTVSLDLNSKWLDRIKPQMEANGIDFARHDTIFGDCFDWLSRLGKRGELFDLVIVDPPSSSVGKKKKRWSVKNDMAELVALAAPLVKKGGLLWTTTNSASISPDKFARMCKQGLDDAGIPDAKLERVVPMPEDFPHIGSQPVKNLVWRIP